MDKMKNRTWVLIFLFLAAALAAVWFLAPKKSTELVGIYQDGTLLQTVALDRDQIITVEGPAGKNVICIKNGEIFVQEADCPDKVCVKHGALLSGGTPIICLPNRLVICWTEPSGAVDAVSGRRA